MVDIFDSDTLKWRAAKLSQRRSNLAATTLAGRYAIFGGGSSDLPNPLMQMSGDIDAREHQHQQLRKVVADIRSPLIGRSNVVDIYDVVTDRWKKLTLRCAELMQNKWHSDTHITCN